MPTEKSDWIESLLAQLTLEEKVGMIHGAALFHTKGVERLEIPPLKMSDGPMGVRKEMADDQWVNNDTADYVTYLPSNCALASTWNPQLARRVGHVLGEEARGRGKDMILAPGINIQRSPLCGRNFEYMSEDPCLVAAMAAPFIRGIQENDVSACVKHFAANSQETGRMGVDAVVDARALREIYLPGFRAAVKEGGSYALMGAYNRLNGAYCCQSAPLLDDLLRNEWHFDGVTVSDWGAVHSTEETARAGLDIEMACTVDFDRYFLAGPLLGAVRSGRVSEKDVDEKVRHVLRLMRRLKMIGPERQTRCSGCYNTPEHRQEVSAAAQESIVLLKNDGGRLPLQRERLKNVGVIGLNAVQLHAPGGGSAEIKALYENSPLMGLRQELGGNVAVTYAQGYGPEGDSDPGVRRRLREEAVELAGASDRVIVCCGLNHDFDVEGSDRRDMRLPYGQDELIRAVLDVRPDAVVVVLAGSPVEMGVWADKADAILWCWYAGMEGGRALAQVLLGKVNPSGRLPESFPRRLEDAPDHCIGDFGDPKRVEYREGVMVGYRYYDTYGVAPQFCFGHGLSYTRFEYLRAEAAVSESREDVFVRVEVTVRNSGGRAGAEVVQLYVADPEAGVVRPSQELKGFQKISLQPGEEKTVVLQLNTDAFGWYDVKARRFRVEPGEFVLRIGSSSRDIRLQRRIELRLPHTYA